MAEDCIKTIKSGSDEMSVNMCTILDDCVCGGDNCCSDEENKKSKRGNKMVKVEILTSPGCTSCAKVEKMLNEMNVKYKVIDMTKNPKVLEKYQVMTAPGIIINGKLEFSGVPSRKELGKRIK